MDSRDDDWLAENLVRIILSFREILLVLFLAGQFLVSIVLFLESVGAPRWLAVGSLALFPFACLLAVRWLGAGQEMNTLQLTDLDGNQDMGRSTCFERRLMDPHDVSRFRPRLR